MMVTVASRALAAQISLPSGDTSKPSTPLPAGRSLRRRTPSVRLGNRFDDADGAGINVRGNDLIEAPGNDNHVRAILARAENPIHTLAARIVTSDNFVRLRREIKFSARKCQPVGGAQRAEIDRRQRLASN